MPDAKTARHSVVWAMVLIGSFYIMTTFLGFGAATIVGPRLHQRPRRHQHERAAAGAGAGRQYLLRLHLGHRVRHHSGRGRWSDHQRFHFLRSRFLDQRHPQGRRSASRAKKYGWRASRRSWSAQLRSFIAILLGPTANVAFLVALAFAVAASANLPVIVLSIFWRRFNTAGAVTGLAVGCSPPSALILVSPSIMAIDPPTVAGAARHLIQAKPIFPLENPGILSIPLGFLGAIVGTLVSHEPTLEAQVQRAAGAVEHRAGRGKGFRRLDENSGAHRSKIAVRVSS